MNSEILEFNLIKNKKDFILKITNLNKIFFIDGKKYEYYLMPFRDFELIKKVEKEAKEFLKNNEIPKNFKINYIKKPDDDVAFKIDIKAAYWYAAGKLFLSKETFEKGLQGRYSKNNRLVALGSLASKTIIKTYNKGILVSEIIEKKETESIYYFISSNIDTIMSMSGGGYWVDCAFLNEIQKNDFCDFLNELKYKFTEERIFELKKNENIFFINKKVYNFEHEKKK